MIENKAVKDDFSGLIKSLFPGNRFDPQENSKITVAVAAADHVATLKSVKQAAKAGIANFMLFGSSEGIRAAANTGGIDVSEFEIIHCPDHYEAAKQAVSAVAEETAHILMKGGVHTSVFTRAFLNKSKGLVPGGGLISHTALFKVAGFKKPFLLTDGAINIAPDFEKKKRIVFNAVEVSRALGNLRPSIACICPVETVNPRILSTVDAERLVLLQEETRFFGDAVIEGPMALDVALSADAAEVKGVVGEVPGNPDILFVPNLDTGNALYKSFAFQHETLAAGIIAGLRVPVVLTSRSDDDITRFLSLYMALVVTSGIDRE
ncbi:MAG: hypothetical protein KAQ69_03985 [Spirochaetales bacterium]|nr:hypothetical protein [Spirochaetales bacterium]